MVKIKLPLAFGIVVNSPMPRNDPGDFDIKGRTAEDDPQSRRQRGTGGVDFELWEPGQTCRTSGFANEGAGRSEKHSEFKSLVFSWEVVTI